MLTPKQAFWWLRGWLSKSKACGNKQRYSRPSAHKAKKAMEEKTNRKFDIYWCLWCHKFHIGGSVKR